MATETGNEGVISFGGTDVTELKAWSLDEASEQIDDTAMGDPAKTSKPGLPAATGQIECHYDEGDSVQEAMSVQAEGVLVLYPKGNVTGRPRVTLSVQITGRSNSGAIDEILPQTFNYGLSSGSVVRDLVP